MQLLLKRNCNEGNEKNTATNALYPTPLPISSESDKLLHCLFINGGHRAAVKWWKSPRMSGFESATFLSRRHFIMCLTTTGDTSGYVELKHQNCFGIATVRVWATELLAESYSLSGQSVVHSSIHILVEFDTASESE